MEGGHCRVQLGSLPSDLQADLSILPHRGAEVFLHIILHSSYQFPIDGDLEGSMHTSQILAHIRWRVHPESLANQLPAPFEVLGWAGHLEVINVHGQQELQSFVTVC